MRLRLKASKCSYHYPGDKSFKCKAIRERLRADFESIRKLTPEPLLINSNHHPKIYGPCQGDQAVPSHWYRLKTCEAGSKFVSAYKRLLSSSSSSGLVCASQRHPMVLALPEFLSQLKLEGVLPSRRAGRGLSQGQGQGTEEDALLNRLSQLYIFARSQDGDFPETKFMEFSSSLQQLKQMLPPPPPAFQEPLDLSLSLSQRPGLQQDLDPAMLSTFSLEPLIGTSRSGSDAVQSTSPYESDLQHTPPPSHHKEKSSIRRGHRDRDLSPLIAVTTNTSSCPDSSYVMPETPL